MAMSPASLTSEIKSYAMELGFDAVGITTAEPLAEGARLREWLAAGNNAGMKWMGNPETREDPHRFLPGARSVVVAGVSSRVPDGGGNPGAGRLASFARFPDYHDTIGRMLEKLLARLGELAPGSSGKCAVDSSPLLERALASRAGLGWPGKSSCLVSPVFGPWLLLGEVVTSAVLAPDSPFESRCGECTSCRDACPAGAVADGVLDARKCVAYLTVEHRGDIPEGLRAVVGDRAFGCEECLKACPWGREAPASRALGVAGPVELPARDYGGMTDEDFKARFAGTSLARAGRARLARNVAVVAANRKSSS